MAGDTAPGGKPTTVAFGDVSAFGSGFLYDLTLERYRYVGHECRRSDRNATVVGFKQPKENREQFSRSETQGVSDELINQQTI